MDKNAIKKYATWARTELISRVTQRAEKYEISADADPNADTVRDIVLTETEKKQRAALIKKVKEKGFDQVMEEVAYTWFNRFSALRFMEVNNYLPSRVRVFTDENNEFKPQILTEAIHMELEGLDMEKVYALKESNNDEELFKYLIITQCNALSEVLPEMFQKISDYTELLFPDNLLRDGSVIQRMISDIDEKDWNVSEGGQVEILGWLYQYYISEKHEEVVDPLHGKVVKKEEIPAATALFTTDWVVRYIIDNSVGRYWIERNPSSNLKNELEYFVTPKDGKIPVVNESIQPEEVTVFDPCMGSAHFGVYAFDVLEKIYTEYGYTEREAAASIVENNLYGLDIDDRSAQIAYFAIMMKAMQYDHRFLKRGIQPKFYSIPESNNIDSFTVEYFANGDAKLKKNISSIIDDFKDAKEYGSLIHVKPVDFNLLYARFAEIKNGDIQIYTDAVLSQLFPLVRVAEILSNKYSVVATNPPYLNKYDAKLKKFATENYKDYSSDLFSIFMYDDFDFCKKNGYSGFMTPMVWMFIKTYESLRKYVLSNKAIITLIQFEYSAFEEATVPICSFVLKNGKTDSKGLYFRLSDFTGGMEVQRKKMKEALNNPYCGYYYESDSRNFTRIPNSPIAYSVSGKIFDIYESSKRIADYGSTREGMATGCNDLFMRFWFEIDEGSFSNKCRSRKEAVDSKKKWFPYNKGGDFRKWYGNDDYVVNWENDGFEIMHFKDEKTGRIRSHNYNLDYIFHEGITWTALSSGNFGCRYSKEGKLADSKGSMLYLNEDKNIFYFLGLLNSAVSSYVMGITSQTLDFRPGRVSEIPVIIKNVDEVEQLVIKSVKDSKDDWDSFETSLDFQKHPLIQKASSIADAFACWKSKCNERFYHLKSSEEEINRIFIEIYGLQDELSSKEDDKNVTVRKANLNRDIRSFISYAVGCMFGRYSLDQNGLVFAGGGEWNPSKYKTFPADKDGILPICDDEYFDDDITGLFINFVRTVYGEDTLKENLKFIADALGGDGSPREVIRKYFLNDFYTDHLKTYQKRPIYWLFDSGKKNGFKCLIYMHRYQPDTIARIRTDYVHEQQARYRTAISGLERQLLDAPASERVRLNNQLKKLKDQAEETRIYEEKIHHLADQMISIDLDDGVKHNYEIFQDVLAKIK